MGMFKTREPRRFNRVSIYTSERQDKLDKLVRDVKREMGELPAEDIEPDRFKGKFAQFTPHAQGASDGRRRLTWPLAMIIIILLLLVWHYLLTGRVFY